MYTTRNRRARIAGVAALALSGLMLSSCSQLPGGDGSEGSGENVGAAASTTSEMKEDFDTGEYDTTFYEPFREITDENSGKLTETTEIINNLLLAAEVDDAYEAASVAWKPFIGDWAFGGTREKLISDRFPEQYQSGASRTFRSSEGDRVFSVSAYRFDSPETAQEVQAALAADARTGDESSRPYTDRPIEALEGTIALEAPSEPPENEYATGEDADLTTFSTHNEFLVTASLSAPEEITDGDTAFVSDYLRAQAPLLDAVPTHRTEAGFGRLENWVDVDPDDVVRHAVRPLAEDSEYNYPARLNSRGFAGLYGLDYAKTSDAFRSAGVEGVGAWDTAVVRTRDEAAAEDFRDFLKEEDSANEPTPYEEPQGLPNTTCATTLDELSKTYSCTMVYGRYVAQSSITDKDLGSETAVNRDGTEEESKTKLSQRMAAQYELFKDAEANPDGTPRPQRTAVNSSEEPTGESSPAGGGDGSSEPAEPAETPANREENGEN